MAQATDRQLIFNYDHQGDVLDIAIGQAKSALSEEVADDIFVRLDEKTGEVVGFMMLNFTKHFKSPATKTRLPVTGRFELVKA